MHNKYIGTGLPSFTRAQLSKRTNRHFWVTDMCNVSDELRGLKSVRRDHRRYTALDAINAFRALLDNQDNEDVFGYTDAPCAHGLLKALCMMITPQIATALYYHATKSDISPGRWGKFERGRGIFHALERHDVGDDWLYNECHKVLKNAARGA